MTTTERPYLFPVVLRRAIGRHAREAAPLECCGVIVGRGRQCWAVMPVANVARRPDTRFEVDPVAHIAIRRVLREQGLGLDVIGAYHSHPRSRPELSPRDIAQAHYAPWLHVVIGRERPRGRFSIRAYVVSGGRAICVPLVASSH